MKMIDKAAIDKALADHGDTLLTMMREQSIAAMLDRDEDETYGISLDDDGVPYKYSHSGNDGYIAEIDDRVIWSDGSTGEIAWDDVWANEHDGWRGPDGEGYRDSEYEPTDAEYAAWAEVIVDESIRDGILSLDSLLPQDHD